MTVENDKIGRQIGEADWRCEEQLMAGNVNRNDVIGMHKELCEEALALMKLKNQDYACLDDPFKNFRYFGEIGILVRMSDKLARLRSFVENKQLAVKTESIRDTTLDLINYSVLLYSYLVDAGYMKPIEKVLDNNPAP